MTDSWRTKEKRIDRVLESRKRMTDCDWRELVRVMNTRKCVTTNMTNGKGQRVCQL